MNQTVRLFYPLLFLSFALLVSCSKDDDEINPETGIVGTWRLTDGEYTIDDLSIRDFYEKLYNDAGVEVKEDELDQLEAVTLQNLGGVFDDGTTFEFQDDGVIIIDGPDDDDDGQGTWDIQNNQTLVIGGGTDGIEFTITNLTNSELRLLYEEEDSFNPTGNDPQTITIGLTLIFAKQ
ncbi:MAG: hypothetical protein RIG62_14825 [Cyclobacteriaceae bacterium]